MPDHLASAGDFSDEIAQKIAQLKGSQAKVILELINQFLLSEDYCRRPESDLITDEVLQKFGDALKIHHAASHEPLTKDRFEYTLERVLNEEGIKAARHKSKTNPGHDMTIAIGGGDQTFSLKTEAAAGISTDLIHISKAMELGKGEWNLTNQRQQFLRHMENYDRIITLRRIAWSNSSQSYELVEIPKALLLEAADAPLVFAENSRQDPVPGYCTVTDEAGNVKFQLYFDGGTERKLQIRKLRKELCIVHATWTLTTKSEAQPATSEVSILGV